MALLPGGTTGEISSAGAVGEPSATIARTSWPGVRGAQPVTPLSKSGFDNRLAATAVRAASTGQYGEDPGWVRRHRGFPVHPRWRGAVRSLHFHQGEILTARSEALFNSEAGQAGGAFCNSAERVIHVPRS